MTSSFKQVTHSIFPHSLQMAPCGPSSTSLLTLSATYCSSLQSHNCSYSCVHKISSLLTHLHSAASAMLHFNTGCQATEQAENRKPNFVLGGTAQRSACDANSRHLFSSLCFRKTPVVEKAALVKWQVNE